VKSFYNDRPIMSIIMITAINRNKEQRNNIHGRLIKYLLKKRIQGYNEIIKQFNAIK